MFSLIICKSMCVSLELSRRRDYSSDTHKPSSQARQSRPLGLDLVSFFFLPDL